MHNYAQLTNTLYMATDFTLTNKLLRLLTMKIDRLTEFQEELYNDTTMPSEDYRKGCINTAFVLNEELKELYNNFVEEHQQ